VNTTSHWCFCGSRFGLSLLSGSINIFVAAVTAGGDICIFRGICLLASVVNEQLRITTEWKVQA
jgi:hypothetical protein